MIAGEKSGCFSVAAAGVVYGIPAYGPLCKEFVCLECWPGYCDFGNCEISWTARLITLPSLLCWSGRGDHFKSSLHLTLGFFYAYRLVDGGLHDFSSAPVPFELIGTYLDFIWYPP